MTAPEPPIPARDEDDLLAAEYVLGVLDRAERARVEMRIRREPVMAARAAAWEMRLAPLNAGYPEVRAPNLLPRIERRLFAAERRGWLALLPGFVAGAASAAALAVVLALAVLPPPVPPLTATLAGEGAVAFDARLDRGRGTLRLIRTAGEPAPPGRDLQLWAIGPEGVPVSLGLIGAADTLRPVAGLPAGVVLAVSLEPAGDSPEVVPTGPVLATGTLTVSER